MTNEDAYLLLSLDYLSDEVSMHIRKHDAVNTRKDSTNHIGPMLPETRQLLLDFYAPFNQELAELLNDDKYLWND